jgi:hypothetical protein
VSKITCLVCYHAALRIFLAQHVDVVILEVGIGGRLDATNIIDRPVVTAVTSLGFDHMEMLGDTLPVNGLHNEHGNITSHRIHALRVQCCICCYGGKHGDGRDGGNWSCSSRLTQELLLVSLLCSAEDCQGEGGHLQGRATSLHCATARGCSRGAAGKRFSLKSCTIQSCVHLSLLSQLSMPAQHLAGVSRYSIM